MSIRSKFTRGNPVPRWSNSAGLKTMLGLPALIAGLLASRAWVSVGPPLSARGPSSGSRGAPLVPIWLPAIPSEIPVRPVSTPMRLKSLAATSVPEMSSSVPSPKSFPATRVWLSVTLVKLIRIPPPEPLPLLS